MLRIIRESSFRDVIERFREFDYRGHAGWGFSFPCEAGGTVLPSCPEAARNLAACLAGVVDGRPVVDRGIRTWTTSVRIPALAECHCGARLELAGDVECHRCHREFNSAGQELAPRELWGEETGETAADYYAGRAEG